jgi:multicomponent Na+:H+ antiporter subunit C
MRLVEAIVENINYLGGMALFVIGLYMVVAHTNLIKRIFGVNIMDTGIFLFFVGIGDVTGGRPPLLGEGTEDVVFINPLPSVLILTGIVVVVSITVYSLSLVIRLYETYGTIDQKEIARMMEAEAIHD